MRTTLIAVAAVTLSACAGNSFDGKVAGESISIKSAAFLQNRDGDGKPTSAMVLVADVEGGCDYIKSNRNPKNGTYVRFILYNRDTGSGSELAASKGDYTVIDYNVNFLTQKGLFATSVFTKNDTNCSNVLAAKNADAKSGVIKVDSFKAEAGGNISGSFDITYGDQADHITGGFNAQFCDATFSTQPNCE
ncbi:MAG: hypothetical protein QM723_35620 [Myxococcaceae bacterium]